MKRPTAGSALLIVCLMLTASPLAAQLRPVSTYSIVARDSATGQMGVAVQSHWFSVGQIVPWAEAGVGAVATQSFVDPSYGKLGLDLLRAGKSAPDALRDRKSTRLNSSHGYISYAVFCLKKKN